MLKVYHLTMFCFFTFSEKFSNNFVQEWINKLHICFRVWGNPISLFNIFERGASTFCFFTSLTLLVQQQHNYLFTVQKHELKFKCQNYFVQLFDPNDKIDFKLWQNTVDMIVSWLVSWLDFEKKWQNSLKLILFFSASLPIFRFFFQYSHE